MDPKFVYESVRSIVSWSAPGWVYFGTLWLSAKHQAQKSDMNESKSRSYEFWLKAMPIFKSTSW
jgi:hypothetical protein